MDVHKIKCDADPFRALDAGEKTHEVRVADRDYKVGDILHICNFKQQWGGKEDGRGRPYVYGEIFAFIEHITAPGTYGLSGNVCVMSIRVVRKKTYSYS